MATPWENPKKKVSREVSAEMQRPDFSLVLGGLLFQAQLSEGQREYFTLAGFGRRESQHKKELGVMQLLFKRICAVLQTEAVL